MAVASSRISFDPGKDLEKMIQQRATQEGISVSEYLREAVLLEMWFSGDVEAMTFIAKRVGKRVKEVLLDKVAGVDLKDKVEALGVI